MSSPARIGWGHALTSCGMLVRRASVPLAAVALAVFVLTGLASTGHTIAPASALAVPLCAFIACRVAAVSLAMVGWLVFTPEHRSLLGHIADGPRGGARRPA